MLEMLTGGAVRTQPLNPVPILGYNFDQGKSTSGATTTAYSGGSIVSFGVGGELAGYTKGLRTLNTIATLAPLQAASVIGRGDFTLEFYAWFSVLPGVYHTVFNIAFPGNLNLMVRFGDAGYGQRLQFCLNIAEVYSTPLTQQSIVNKWRHFALVRENKRCRVYIDGVQTNLALGVSTAYTAADFLADYDLSGTITAATLTGTTAAPADTYMPEFALYQGAKYRNNFTRPIGPMVV